MICSNKPSIFPRFMTFIASALDNVLGKTTSEKNSEELEDDTIYDFDKFETEDFDVNNDVYPCVREFHADTYDMIDSKFDGCKFIVRISGCEFGDITQYLKPHDQTIRECFIETTKDLVERYNAQCGWTMGDNILLFFDYDQNPNESIVWNTETIVTEIASYATIRFDKHLNTSVDKLVEEYSVEIVADLIDQDPVFRTILITPKNEEDVVEYMYYILDKVNDIEQCADLGIIVKPCINSKEEAGCTYRYIYDQDEDAFFNIDFIIRPYIKLVSH